MAYVQNPDYDDNQDQQQTTGNAPTQINSGQQSASIGGTANTSAGQKASSGRFTNIQKYLGANQQAGTQIAGNVANQVNKNVQQEKTQADDAQKMTNSSINTAQDTLTRGTNLNQSLAADNPFANATLTKAQSFNPADARIDQTGSIFDETLGNKYQSIANDSNQLQDLTKFRYGANVDENALTQQGQTAQNNANVYQAKSQDQLNQTKDEAGRFGLVKQTFARPNYTAGQQRLDNVFFGTSGKQGIGQVQNVAKQNATNAGQFATNATNNLNTIGTVAQNESKLATDLNNTTSNLKTSFTDMLGKRYDPTKDAYGNEIDRYNKNYNILSGKAQTQQLMDDDIWNKLGLQEGQQTFNVFKDSDLSKFADINDVRNRQLTNQDVSKTGDVNTLAALNALSKSGLDNQGNVVKNYTNEYDTAGNLGDAVTMKTGEQSVQANVAKAYNDFLQNALGTTLTARNSQNYNNGWGNSGSTTKIASANIGDILSRAGIDPTKTMSVNTPSLGSFEGLGAANDQLGKYGMGILTGGLHFVPGMENISQDLGRFVGGAVNSVTSLFGNSDAQGGAERSAQNNANNELKSQIDSYLKNAGFYNTISKAGQKTGESFLDRQNRVINEGKVASQSYADAAKTALANVDMQLRQQYNPGSSSGGIVGRGTLIENGTPEAIARAKELEYNAMAALEQQYGKQKFDANNMSNNYGVGTYDQAAALANLKAQIDEKYNFTPEKKEALQNQRMAWTNGFSNLAPTSDFDKGYY